MLLMDKGLVDGHCIALHYNYSIGSLTALPTLWCLSGLNIC